MFAGCKDGWKEGTEPLRVLAIMLFLYTKLHYGEGRHTVSFRYIKLKIKAKLTCGARGQDGGNPWGQGVVAGLWHKKGF